MSQKKITTMNGEAYLVEFSTERGGETIEGKLMLPQRMKQDIEGKVPTIMIYGGKKLSKNNKEYHDCSFIDIEKPSKSSGN